jgi:hypothetical protein
VKSPEKPRLLGFFSFAISLIFIGFEIYHCPTHDVIKNSNFRNGFSIRAGYVAAVLVFSALVFWYSLTRRGSRLMIRMTE